MAGGADDLTTLLDVCARSRSSRRAPATPPHAGRLVGSRIGSGTEARRREGSDDHTAAPAVRPARPDRSLAGLRAPPVQTAPGGSRQSSAPGRRRLPRPGSGRSTARSTTRGGPDREPLAIRFATSAGWPPVRPWTSGIPSGASSWSVKGSSRILVRLGEAAQRVIERRLFAAHRSEDHHRDPAQRWRRYSSAATVPGSAR